jgi:hypothetical protein
MVIMVEDKGGFRGRVRVEGVWCSWVQGISR